MLVSLLVPYSKVEEAEIKSWHSSTCYITECITNTRKLTIIELYVEF